MASSVSGSVFEGIEFSEANSVLLMSLMEETQEDQDQYYGDDRLVSMIQSLEAEISARSELQGFEDGHVDGQDCFTSVSDHDYSWVDDHMEVASSSQFDEMNGWSSYYGDEMDGIAMEYEFENYIGSDYSQLCYLPQEPSDAVFSS